MDGICDYRAKRALPKMGKHDAQAISTLCPGRSGCSTRRRPRGCGLAPFRGLVNRQRASQKLARHSPPQHSPTPETVRPVHREITAVATPAIVTRADCGQKERALGR